MIYLIDPKHATGDHPGTDLFHILYGIPPCPQLCAVFCSTLS